MILQLEVLLREAVERHPEADVDGIVQEVDIRRLFQPFFDLVKQWGKENEQEE